ncbi:MAG: lysine--tRNA ligase [Thermoplasmata archaeon]
MHWADVVASKVEGKQVVSTGISPSGEIHVGNMREVLTGEIVCRALRDAGKDVVFYYEADDMDPLRKVPKGIDQSFSRYIGQPLFRVPAPDGKHPSWSEQFIEPFRETLDIVGVKLNFLYTHELYQQGAFNDLLRISFEKREQIARILSEVSGKQVQGNYYPFNMICDSCGRLDTTEITSFSWPIAEYKCSSCNYSGSKDVRNGNGKLPWRVEWPAKWAYLHVTIEPFGKDHAAAGGSYDTGKRIATEIFGINPPYPVVYEWILLRNQGAMHSSKGVLIRSIDMVRMAPPEILRFLIAKNNPERHIEMDAGRGLISLVNEYDIYERVYFGKEEVEDKERKRDMNRVYELSQPGEIPKEMPLQVSFNHLINLVQLKGTNEEIIESLKKSSFMIPRDTRRLVARIEAVRYWLDHFAGEEFKIKLNERPPDLILNNGEIAFLRNLVDRLTDGLSPEDVNKVIHESCSSSVRDKQGCFSLLYKIFLNRETGPRLGYLFTSMGMEKVKGFLESYLNRDH